MIRRLLFVVFACVAASAAAESLPVRGVYPAGNDAAAALQTIAVEPFGGLDGQALGIALADQLRGVSIDGKPYFRILPGGAGDNAEAVLNGAASAEVSRRDAEPKEREVCVERDKDDKCIKREKQKVPCWETVVRLDPRVRLIGADGALIAAIDEPRERAVRYCRDEQRPSQEEIVRQLIDELARDARVSLAPVERLEDIRVMEKRDGMASGERNAFRDAVTLTKQDAGLACEAFQALESGNHASVLFNLGLCAESAGDLARAEDYYRRALTADPRTDYAGQGLRRLAERHRADAQLASHYAE